MEKEIVCLKDGTLVEGDSFNTFNDLPSFQNIFANWINLNRYLQEMGGRGVNVPDVLSEGLFCLAYDAVRTNNTAHSYDCVMKKTGQGVQLKSTSIEKDLTSFGPKSEWDRLYFANFAPYGVVSGKVEFYNITKYHIYNFVLNKKKNETFRDQQLQGKRPRLSIIDSIIKENNLMPETKIDVFGETLSYFGLEPRSLYDIKEKLS